MKRKDLKQFNNIVKGSCITGAEFDKDTGLFIIHLDNDSAVVVNMSSIAVARKE